jgi:hypothetical protein
MLDLERATKDQLKEAAKAANIPDYETLTKKQLLLVLSDSLTEEPEEVVSFLETPGVEIPTESVAKLPEIVEVLKPLSTQGIYWRDYLKTIGISASDFLTRYPDHTNKEIIKEVKRHEK